jgi:hypothetical protein
MKLQTQKKRGEQEEGLNIRLIKLTETNIEEEIERQDPIPEVEEQNNREYWLSQR